MLHAKRYGSWAGTLLLALALVVSLSACDSDDDDPAPEPDVLADILEQRDDLSILFDAVEESGQLDLTADPDADITVFAPNNGAFADIELSAALAPENEALLADIVQYHVVPGGLLSSEIDEGTLTSALGEDLFVETRNGALFINEGQVVDADNEADNGVLHVVDELLLENRSLLERVSLTASTQALVGSAGDTGLVDAFEEAENWTLFAPINEAFEAADTGDLSDEELAEAVQYHVALGEDGPISAADLVDRIDANGGEATVPTAQGESITFTQEGDDIILNGGQAIIVGGGTDRFTDNYTNVFHLIDGVLIPPSFEEDPEASFELFASEADLDAGSGAGVQCIVAQSSGDVTFYNGNDGGIFTWTGSSLIEERSASDLNADIDQEDNSIDRCEGVTVDGNDNVYFLFRSNETSEQSSWPTAVYKLDSSGSTSVLAFEEGLTGITPVNGTLYLNGNDFRGAPGDGIFSISDTGEGQSLTEVVTDPDLDLANGLLEADSNGNLYLYSGGFGDGSFEDVIARVQDPAGSATLDVFIDPYAGDSPLSFDEGNNLRDLRVASTGADEYLVVYNGSFQAPDGDEWASINLADQSITLLFTATELTGEIGQDDYVSGFTQATAVSADGDIFPASRDLNDATHYIGRVSNILP